MDFDQRFRAILCADIVASSRLMEVAELETHARWRTLCVAVIDPTVVSHRGEVVKNTGDGFIAVFESPLDAVHCATEIQAEVAAHAAQTAPERRILLRMGMHWQRVIFDDNEVFGTGVIIAVRLQAAAPAGGVVISASLIEQIGELRDIKLDDLGNLSLKNLSRPVRAYALAVPGVERNSSLGTPARRTSRARPPSVGVLPFANHSADPGDSYFAEGFVEDIVVTLSNISELLIVSRGSTLAFRRQTMDVARISSKLGVRYLLSGSVRRSDARIRISVEFSDAMAASVIWAERYDIAAGEIFDLQDEIALKIVSKIVTSVRLAEVKRALRKPPRSLNAYDRTLRGLDLLYRMDSGSFSQARTLLEQACEEDRDYAVPYAFLAQWYVFAIGEGWSSDPEADAAEVVRLAQTATQLDPHNALALAIQGHGRGMFFRDYDSAVDLVDRAVAASPSSFWAWVFSAVPYGYIGRAEIGVARAERAVRLSPLDLHAFFNYCVLGQSHYLNGTFEEAIRWSRKSLNLNPRFGNAARVLAASLLAVGCKKEAAQVARHHREILPGFRVSDYARRCPFVEPQASLYVERLLGAGLRD
jgi:adenylate cyclase